MLFISGAMLLSTFQNCQYQLPHVSAEEYGVEEYSQHTGGDSVQTGSGEPDGLSENAADAADGTESKENITVGIASEDVSGNTEAKGSESGDDSECATGNGDTAETISGSGDDTNAENGTGESSESDDHGDSEKETGESSEHGTGAVNGDGENPDSEEESDYQSGSEDISGNESDHLTGSEDISGNESEDIDNADSDNENNPGAISGAESADTETGNMSGNIGSDGQNFEEESGDEEISEGDLEPVSENPTEEIETEEAAEKKSCIWQSENSELEIEVKKTDGTAFPQDTVLEVLMPEDLFAGEENPVLSENVYRDRCIAAAAKCLAEQYCRNTDNKERTEEEIDLLREVYRESFISFLFCEIRLYDPEGRLMTDDLDLTLWVNDAELAGSVINGSAETELFSLDGDRAEPHVSVFPHENVSCSVSGSKLCVQFGGYGEMGIGLAILDRSRINDEALTQETAVWEAEELLVAENYGISLLAGYSPPGTIASAEGSGYTPVNVGDRRYASRFSEIQRNSSSSVIPWDTSGGHVTQGSRVNSGGQTYTYFVPKDDTAKGKFGFRVTNVAYNREEKCAVDMNITVVGYNNYTYSSAGNKIEGVYPCVGYTPKGGIAYQPFLPAIRLKCDLLRSGTDTPVAGSYRFTMTDIDAGQIYGLTLFDGAIEGKYCTTSTVIHTGIRSLSDGKDYYMMYAPDIASSETNVNHAISYEVSGMSSFGLFIDSEKRSGTVGGYSGNAIRGAYDDVKDGVWNYGTEEAPGALMGWDSWAFGPPEISPVMKYVSNDQAAWTDSNELPSVRSDFWYQLEVYVPEMSGYSFQQFFLRDQLPSGVEFAGDVSVIKVETGEDAGQYFQVSGDSDLIFACTGLPGFLGYTYQIRFRVRMNPEKIQPSVSGTTAYYSVKNTAALYYQTNADAAALCTVSNEVYTSAVSQRPQPEKPDKKINVNGSFTDSQEYADREAEITFTVRQKIPACEPCWYMDSFTFQDQLEKCLELVSVSAGMEQSPGSAVFTADQSGVTKNGWTFTKSGQNISLKNSSDILPGYFDGNTVYRMDIVVRIREEYDLSGYYASTGAGKTMAVIPNTASTVFSWGSENFTQNTNQVKVMVGEVFGTVELTKKNALTGEHVPDAGFTLYQWDGSSWGTVCEFSYNRETKSYRAPQKIYKNKKNQGKFRIVESKTPQGYVGSWTKEFVMDGTPGSEQKLTYQAVNEMATGTVTVKKTSEEGNGLNGAVYEIFAKEQIVSPQGKVLTEAGMKVAVLTTGADGTAVSGALYPGVYEVREAKPPQGYSLNKEPQTVRIVYVDKNSGASREQAVFKNRQTLVYLCKVSSLAEGEKQKLPIKGVSFAVWEKQNGTVETADRYVTDGNGMIELKGYLPGTYCYKEMSVPDGYVMDTEIHEFTIDQYGYCDKEDARRIEVENAFICASFAKKDKATGEYVAGAKLKLTDQNGKTVDTWISEKKPHTINRIAAGVYTLEEISAPDGYKKADPIEVMIRPVSTVQSFEILNIKYVSITLTKSVLTQEIVWKHGNPVFTFCVEGKDLDGDYHIYYDTVEFTQDGSTTAETMENTAVFRVPAGNYTAYEMNVIRYRLWKIDGVSNGSVSGPAVIFGLAKNQNGAAVFHNRKTSDDGLSDTAFLRNTIINENEASREK